MPQWLTAALAANPILTLFVVIGLGYLLGQVNFFGFRLGVAGVLFAGLAVGALGPAIALPEIVSSLGLVIFVYTIGIQSGPAFFANFRREGMRTTLLALVLLIFAGGLTLLLARPLGLSGPRAAGLYCGALTNTPALAATRERVRFEAAAKGLPEEKIQQLADEPVVAYSLAYPLGVIGVLLCFQLTRRLWRVELKPSEAGPQIQTRNFVVKNPGVMGHALVDVLHLHRDPGFVVSRVQHGGAIQVARPDTLLEQGDIVVAVGDDEGLERAEQIFGAPSDAHIEFDRSELDFRRMFVSSPQVVGKRIRDLDLETQLSATITRVRRSDTDVVPTADTRLEYGDRVRVLTRRENFERLAKFFGDSIKGTAETDFASVALGMVLGTLVGLLPIPLPGGSSLRLGLAGGTLLVALVLGQRERTGRITWIIPVSANLTLRQVGLLLFLAGVGTRAGYSFVRTLRSDGWQMVAAGAVLTFVVTLAALIAGYKLLKMPFDSVMGLVSGLQTQPACLAYASGQAKSDRPELAYAAVYPVAMIAKIVVAQLLVR